jgi:hypothetical protein
MEQIAPASGGLIRRLPSGRRLQGALENAIALLLLACSLLTIGHPARAAEEQPLEYQVKAAFLLNFTKFVGWPPAAFADEHSPLAICILGEDPFGSTLDEIVKGENVNGHDLAVQRIRRAPAPKLCQVLFISRSEKEIPRILEELGPGVLTVGDGDNFLRDGGIIAFVIQDRRVRFDIDQRAAAKAMLTMSSRLMNVARSVER